MARAAGGSGMRRAGVVLTLLMAAACGPSPAGDEKAHADAKQAPVPPEDAERKAETERISRLGADRGWHGAGTGGPAEDKGAAVFALGDAGGDPETIEKSLTPAPAADAFAVPAAQGLAMSKSPAAEAVLVRLALRDSP